MSSDTPATIETFGSTSLVGAGSNYFLYPNGGAPVELSYGGEPVVAGQFGGWTPSGAERTANGYVVAWKMADADQYTVWYLDDSGNYLSSAFASASGSSSALQSFETSFQQDLNGDGSIGAPPPPASAMIETFGSTSLVGAGSNYFLYPNGGAPVELSYGGAPVVAGQFGGWTPSGAERTANGYVVAWKMADADQYTVWYLDDSGNYLSSAFASASGSSSALQSLETSFQQDLNGDGSIGAPPPPASAMIETFGSTSLVGAGSNYFLYPNGGAPVELSYGGAPVVAGQFGGWTPSGAERTANGYVVAWKMADADQYTVWYLDDSGNYLSSAFASASGSSSALQSLETSFQQDLNGDGSIGAPPPPASAMIETFGSTSLVGAGSNYFLYPNGGAPVELSYGGAPVVAGQFGGWTPSGAERTANGYVVAWKMADADQYTVWYLDDSGNYLSSAFASASGSSSALQSFETSFQQDLNGDGSIGAPPPPASAMIETFGSTSLVGAGSNYFLYPNGGAPVELSYGGAPVVAGQFGGWTPSGAERTANGYVVAWKMADADQYTVWYLDDSGNYLSSAFASASGSSSALQSFETSFQQDLNGDGSIGGSGSGSQDAPQFVYQGVNSNGVQLYDVTWSSEGLHPLAVRVLAPDHPSANDPHSFLIALPVEPGIAQSTYGSGLDELQKLDIQNLYNATIIEPIFPTYSWYADNPTDPSMDYETFMSTLLPAWVDSNFATGATDKNLLIGFSKSGYGALDLLFKHASVFSAAAAWDFPADMTAYDNYGANQNYGTDSNFQDNYRMTGNFIDTWRAPFTAEDRIWISAADTFRADVTDFDHLLTSQGVSHTLGSLTNDAHAWSGGWLSDAVAGLYGLERDLIGNAPTGSSAPTSVAAVVAGSTVFGTDQQQYTAITPFDHL